MSFFNQASSVCPVCFSPSACTSYSTHQQYYCGDTCTISCIKPPTCPMHDMISIFASRQAGQVPSQRSFCKQFSDSITTLHRLELQHTLQGHAGCVNSVSFNETGDILLSGSDDLNIILWDWRANQSLQTYVSGHTSNVFQARALPGTNTVVSCARDGQVRMGLLHPSGGTVPTSRLASHRHSAHKLALDPQHPSCFLSCAEDGCVMRFDVRAPRPVTWRMVCCLPSVTDVSTVRMARGCWPFAHLAAPGSPQGAVQCPLQPGAPPPIWREWA